MGTHRECKSFSRTISGVLQPLVGYKMPVCVHFHISQLTSKLAFQNIMNYLRLLLFFFVLLASLQLTSADCWDRCERYLSHDAVDGKWDYCMNVCEQDDLYWTPGQ